MTMEKNVWIILSYIYMKKLLVLFLCPIVILTHGYVFAELYDAKVKDADNKDYYQAALDVINSAEKSVTAVMYIISYDPREKDSKVKILMDALISAKKRGAAVKVVLEYHSLSDFTPQGLRYNAYNYLKDNGIPVFFDEMPNNCMHAKAVVADGKVTLLGSSNWSAAAFSSSYELNAVIVSELFARRIQDDIEKIPLRTAALKEMGDSFNVPKSFLSGTNNPLSRIVEADSVRSLDLFLILLDENKPKVSYDRIAERLGIYNKMDRISYRRQIKKCLVKLKKRYGLIDFECGYGDEEIDIRIPKDPDTAFFKMPEGYFKYGWDKRLTLAGKAVLITLYSELNEVKGDVTESAILYLSKKYGMKNFTYSKGIQELKMYNLIKVRYSGGFSGRDRTKITISGIYDTAGYEKYIAKLQNIYGRETIDSALKFAEIVCSRYDAAIVEDIARQIEIYGIKNVERAFLCIAKKRPDNPLRTYNYALGILRRQN